MSDEGSGQVFLVHRNALSPTAIHKVAKVNEDQCHKEMCEFSCLGHTDYTD